MSPVVADELLKKPLYFVLANSHCFFTHSVEGKVWRERGKTVLRKHSLAPS